LAFKEAVWGKKYDCVFDN